MADALGPKVLSELRGKGYLLEALQAAYPEAFNQGTSFSPWNGGYELVFRFPDNLWVVDGASMGGAALGTPFRLSWGFVTHHLSFSFVSPTFPPNPPSPPSGNTQALG